jgi:hypothetical protein
MKTFTASLIILVSTLTHLQAQTVVQKKVVDDQYWRITKNVTLNELDRELFGQCGNTIQLTYEDVNLGKTIKLKFATDIYWHRIIYGDFKKWMKTFGEAGIGPSQFQKPTAIDMGTYYVPGSGQRTELFVADYFNNRVQVLRVNLRFTGSGGSGDTDIETVASISNIGSIGDLCVMTIDGYPYLVLTQTENHRIVFYDLSTGSYTYRNAYGSFGSGTGQFKNPLSMDGIKNSWFSTKSIFVQDAGNNRIVRLVPSRNADGTINISWTSTMNYSFRLTSVATDYGGNIWLTDSTNNRLLKYDNNFVYLSTFGTFGTGQVSGTIYGPQSFSTGTYMIKDAAGTTIFKNDVSFLSELWSAQSGGVAYDLGVDMAALSVSGPSNLIGTNISYFVTDWSWIYVTVEKQSGSSWNLVKTFGYPINGVSGQVVPAGANSFTWDGRDANGVLQGPGTYRITAYGREFYEDPDAPTVSRQVTYVPALTGTISGPSNVNYGQNYTWNASGSGGTTSPYTYEWYKGNTYVGNNSYLTTSFTSNTTLYLKVRSGADQITVSKAITVGSGGGCPFVLAETPYGFEPDNNILHRRRIVIKQRT